MPLCRLSILRTLRILLVALLCAAGQAASVAWAAPAAVSLAALVQQAEAQKRELQAIEQRLAQAGATQATREKRATLATQEIERLKSQPPSVARDLALGERLAQAQAQAGELAQEETARRRLATELRAARQRLLRACDRILDADQSESKGGELTPAQRFRWLRLRTTQVEALLGDGGAAQARALAKSEIAAGSGAPQELDDPQALAERADLLRDSADKLHREVERLQARSAELERRQRLRERASRVDEDLFAEQSTKRRSASRPTSQASSGQAGDVASVSFSESRDQITPPVTPPSVPPASGATLHSGPDPSTLDGLLRVEGPGDPSLKLQALAQAQGELEALAADLLRRAAYLEQRAAELRRQK